MQTILLIDDDPGVLKSVGDMLERSGYGVITAADGRSAIAALEARDDIDLVITDYRMPGMDGLSLLRRIRERSSDLPVMIMTGYGDLESYLCAASLGVVRYIGKPIGLRELRQTVRDAVADGLYGRTFKQGQPGRS